MSRILNRQIKHCTVEIQTIDSNIVGADPVTWLMGHAVDEMILLAHADDGVIWARFRNGEFQVPRLSNVDFEQAVLRPLTLQMARVFNQDTEIFLWRIDEGTWCARQVTDARAEAQDSQARPCFDEDQVLWGTGIINFDGEFSLAEDGEEGFHHAPPVRTAEGLFGQHARLRGERKLRLAVRHYLETDTATGWHRIAMSRLTDVGMEGDK